MRFKIQDTKLNFILGMIAGLILAVIIILAMILIMNHFGYGFCRIPP